ncbi:MAG: flagellar basal body-associated FliL family protein [Sedimentisphaerales bacterium]|nr:flagellar basal body-associated FliL family protein [Sedimentisphaerales bacterium]
MAEQKPTPNKEEQKPKKKLPIKTLIIILGILLLEGGTIGVFMAFKGGPSEAGASSDPIVDTQEPEQKKMAEVILAEDFTIDNYTAGRARIVIRCGVAAKVSLENQPKLQEMVAAHQTEIKDTIRTLVSSAQPDHLRDSKKQVIKREIKTGMEEIIGEGLIEDILLPDWQSYQQE